MSDKPVTKSDLLAPLSKVYDPPGLGAPFLLKGHQIIQNLCRNNLTWDKPIDDYSSCQWLKWRNQLMTLYTRYEYHKMYQAQEFWWNHPLLSTLFFWCLWNRSWYVSIHQIGQCWRCSTLLPATWKVTSCTTQVYIHPSTWAATLSVKVSRMIRE